jgi:hypothetical protein
MKLTILIVYISYFSVNSIKLRKSNLKEKKKIAGKMTKEDV